MSNPQVSRGGVTNGKATASLILGVFSIVLSLIPLGGLVLGVVGLILGIIGLKEIKRSDQEGRKRAVSGIICSSLGILLPIILSIIAGLTYMNVDSTVL
ncbi:protein of unknown function [Gracilibacillus orientalis]|uniref:DUF4190 domain-containing protein n=1 Tax=Gracilibacillus orientalis TaxID=334253 RepID=A0A1I4GV47_9BACI|nr:DUF4190 domain-containing protein [Gracilibacillus orientalis]SFL33904.1 protein of unknown function [Gracilibacillus orientalis]